jgi:ECF sigma factor
LPIISLAAILELRNEVTRILSAIQEGDLHVAAKLLPLVYDELRKLAELCMSIEPHDQSLEKARDSFQTDAA